MLKTSQEEDFSDVEDALRKLRPAEPSARFFASVEEALTAGTPREAEPAARGNAAPFPPTLRRSGRLLTFPLRRFAACAALLLCAVGLGLWSFSSASKESVPAVASGGAAASVGKAVAAAAAPVALAIQGAAQGVAARDRRSRGDYRLVNTERRLNSVKPGEIVTTEDGALARRVRYSYMDEYRWEDRGNAAAFVELRPHEEVVSTEMAVY